MATLPTENRCDVCHRDHPAVLDIVRPPADDIPRGQTMHRIAFSLAVLVFFLNPGLACSPSPSDKGFQYGAAEMKAAVEGTWEINLLASDGTQSSVTVQIAGPAQAEEQITETTEGSAMVRPARRALIRSAAACGTRTFFQPAAACVDMTTMGLEVAYVSGDQRLQSVSMSGTFAVTSLVFHSGGLDLSLGNMRTTASVTPKGVASVISTYSPDGTTVTSFTRTSP